MFKIRIFRHITYPQSAFVKVSICVKKCYTLCIQIDKKTLYDKVFLVSYHIWQKTKKKQKKVEIME